MFSLELNQNQNNFDWYQPPLQPWSIFVRAWNGKMKVQFGFSLRL